MRPSALPIVLCCLSAALLGCKNKGGSFPREAQVRTTADYSCSFTRTENTRFRVECTAKKEKVTVNQIKAILSESDEGNLDEREFLKGLVELEVGKPWTFDGTLDDRKYEDDYASYSIHAWVIVGTTGKDRFDFKTDELVFGSDAYGSN